MVLITGWPQNSKNWKPEILREFSEPGKLMEFSGSSVQPQGKIVTNKIIFNRIEYLCKTTVDRKHDHYDVRE